MTIDDAEIIDRSIREPEVFGVIFDRHFEAIERFCVRRLGAARGEDVAGDVFLWAFENRRRFNLEQVDALPWLYRIANNLVRQALRNTGRQRVAFDRWLTSERRGGDELAYDVVAAIDVHRDLVAVATILDLQPPDEVETLLLYAWEQLTYSQIAEVLEIPVGTVRSRIHRLRQHLNDAFITPLAFSEGPTNSSGGST